MSTGTGKYMKTGTGKYHAPGKRYKSIDPTGIAIAAVMGLLALISVFPFYNVFITSFAKDSEVAKQTIYLIPTSLDFSAYRIVFSDFKYLNALFVSIFITIAGTAYNLALTLSGGYVLSKKAIPGRNWMMGFIAFTMFFSGGLIPFYLTIRNYGLLDKLGAMIIPVGINTFYLIIVMNFFKAIPESVEESAKIDGANDIIIFIRIVLPMSLPVIAAIGLYYAVDRWNEWYYAMLFVTDKNKFPLQLLLRDMIVNMTTQMNSEANSTLYDLTLRSVQPARIKMAVIVITTLPILCVYPFVQKYFNKGMILGSIKG